jgi:hypothetical protein
MPALIAVVAGILLGSAVGGSFASLAQLKLRWEWLLLPLFVVQALARGRLLGAIGASQWSLSVWTVASLMLAGMMLLNFETPGMIVGAAGVLMNLDVVLLNTAMPVAIVAATRASMSVSSAELARESGGFYRLSEQGDLLVWLGDAIPFTWGKAVLLVSPGDVALVVAVTVVIVHGMTHRTEVNSLARGI